MTVGQTSVLALCLLLTGCYPHADANAVKLCAKHQGLLNVVWARNAPPVAYCADGAAFVVPKERMP